MVVGKVSRMGCDSDGHSGSQQYLHSCAAAGASAEKAADKKTDKYATLAYNPQLSADSIRNSGANKFFRC